MNKLNVDRLAACLSDIFSEKYGVDVTIRYTPKKPLNEKEEESA